MTVSLSGLAGEYPAVASSCLALSAFGWSYPEAASAALSRYLSKVGETTPLWLAGGCCPPSPILEILSRSIAWEIACRTARALVALCDGSRFGNRRPFRTGGGPGW